MPPRRRKARGPQRKAENAAEGLQTPRRCLGRARKVRDFPFMDFPPEIRMMIYSYLIPSGTTIAIRVVLPDEHEEILETDDMTRTCLEMVIECKPGPRDGSVVSQSEMTTYTASKAGDLADFVNLSVTNRRLREEIMPIFYGTNTFHFESWKTFQPFLSDRSLEALQLMKSFEITIPWNGPLQRWRYHNYHVFPQSKHWNCMLKKKQAFATLRLESLFININIKMTTLRFHWASMGPWIRKRYGPVFSNLDRLGVQIHTAEQKDVARWKLRHGVPDDFVEIRGEDLWNLLAPRMLKQREGRVHEGPEMQDRRISPA